MVKSILPIVKSVALSLVLISETILGAVDRVDFPTASMEGWSYETSFISSTVFNSPQVTVLDEMQAQDLFKKLAAKFYIPYSYINDGCEARAHAMSMVADRSKIKLGKMFLIGSLINDWRYHVAPFVLVKSASGITPYILDPSLNKFAVPFYSWIKTAVGFSFKYNYLYVTSRFIYGSNEKNVNLQSYTMKDYARMNAGLIYFNLLKTGQLFN